MLGLLARFLPGLAGVLPAFFNPWVLVVILAASSVSFLYGTHLGNQRLESYVQAQEQVEKSRKAIIKYVTVQERVIDQETVNELKTRNDQLARDNASMRERVRKHIQSAVNPSVPPTAGGDQEGSTVCFDRSKFVGGLRDALQQFVDGYRQGLERGDRAISALESCVEFTEKQHSLTSGTGGQ